MKHLAWTIVTLLGICGMQGCDTYRILFLGPVGTKSHKNFYSSIVDTLTENNHHVTFVTPFASPKVNPNVKEVVVKEGDFSKYNMNLFDEKYAFSSNLSDIYYALCDETYATTRVQSLVEAQFDVAVISTIATECFLPLLYRMKIPYIFVSPLELMEYAAFAIGNPLFSSFCAHPFLGYGYPFTFWQRLLSGLMDIGGLAYMHSIYQGIEQRCLESGTCPKDMPSIADLAKNSSMMFINSVPALQVPPRPTVPAVVHIGGIHCKPAKQLPQDLQEWIDGAGEDGFIYFSLGSIVIPSTLPERNRQMFVKVFGTLKQRILWKWDKDTMPDLPPNVMLKKWIPQQDILGHPKLRLFITHSGMFSTQESMYHGKPVLGLPVFADQLGNAKAVEREGWGKVIFWEDMTQEILFNNITSIMNNKAMQELVQSKSILMKDQSISPKSAVLFWTEYVVRHKGAQHLRCPLIDMPWYKAYNVDVWLSVVMLSLLILWVLVRLLKAIISRLRGIAKSKKD